MDINVFLLCYNEEILLPHTISHYKKYLPRCKITVYDNESTDKSVDLARSLGCNVISWSSDNCIDDYKYKDIKNNCWKSVVSGWIIMADMDEFVCVTEEELLEEYKRGTSILTLDGLNMIGESKTIFLNDINLQDIYKYKNNIWEYKHICFLRDKIVDMNYSLGCHTCNPFGEIAYSSHIYLNKHMEYLGLEFLKNKIVKRYERSEKMRKKGIALHYTNDLNNITDTYNNSLNTCNILFSTYSEEKRRIINETMGKLHIEYGYGNTFKDITDIVLMKFIEYINNKWAIYIIANDHKRASFFGDPLPRILKTIRVKINGITIVYEWKDEVILFLE